MKKASSKPNQLFHITVGIQPTKDLSLEKELRVVKAAILYADKVKLYSLKVPSILVISRVKNFPLGLRLDFVEKVVPLLTAKDNAQKLLISLNDYRKILRKKHLDIHELQFRKQFETNLEQSWESIVGTANKFVEDSKIDQINSAIKAGLLELHEYKNADKDYAALNLMVESVAAVSAMRAKEKISITEQDRAWISEFVENISNSVSDGSTYPLFDEETGNLVSAGIRSKIIKVPISGVDRGKQTGLARHFLERLPLFEEASVDEILDIRKELDKPLTRFRKAMISFSEDIKSAPWDKDFASEAERIFYREVKPAVLEIEEETKSNQFLASLVRKFVDKPLTLTTGSAISIALSTISTLPNEIAVSLGVGISSAAIIYDGYDEWKKKKRATEQNLLYFYYKAQKRLND